MTADELLAAADRALLLAKRTGKGRVAVANPDAEEELARLQQSDGSPAAVEALAAAIEARDRYTQGHSEQVVQLATRVAMLLGLTADAVERVGQAALLHDVGKLAIPHEILHKHGALDDDEWNVMAEHPVIGEGILRRLAAARAAGADRAPRARALGRQRLPRRAGRSADPDRLADHPRLRRLRGDDDGAPVPARDGEGRRDRRAARARRARSSTPRSSRRCLDLLGA